MIKFVTSIKKKYRDRLINREKQWPPCKAEKLIHLELVEREHGQVHQKGQEHKIVKRTPMVYADLFKVEDGKKPVRKVLVEGDAGIGKTTLCTAVSEDWADEKLFQQFELLLLLPLRHKKVASAGSIPELLKLLHSSQELCRSVATYLEEDEGEKVLIIADGWDELGKPERQKGSFLYELLFGELLPFVSVVLTSRPTASALLHKLPFIDRFVEIYGFKKENIKEYVQSEFASDQLRGCRLLEQLESNPLVESVCSVPLNCAIVCHLWRTLEEALPTTMTELYTKIILNVTLRNLCKISAYENLRSLSNFDALPEDLQQSWWLLCEFSFLALEKDQVVFSEEELVEFFPQGLALDERILCFGLLQTAESVLDVGHGVSFHFLHLTFQEYLSALYIVKQPPDKQLKALQRHARSELFSMVWRFFFGIGFGSVHKIKIDIKEAMGALVSADHLFALAFDNSNCRLDLCHCAFEAKHEQINTEVIKSMNRFVLFDYMTFGTPHTAHDCAAVLYVITHTHKPSEMDIMFNNCGVGDKQIIALADILASKHGKLQVKEMNLHGNKLTCNSVANLFHIASAAFQSIRKLDLGNNRITTESISSMTPWFDRSDHLTELDLSHNPLGCSGLLMLEDVVLAGKLAKLKKLNLQGTLTNDADINGALLATFTEALSVHCCHLFWLDLSVNNLGVPGAQALGTVMSNLTQDCKIFHLFLYITTLGDEGVRAFVQSLEGTCRLMYFYLNNNGIHSAGVSYLADTEGIFHSICLDNNPLGLEGALAVGRMLSSGHCDVLELSLSGCRLTTACGSGHLPNTESLSLDENVNSEVCVGQQCCQMPTKKMVERLHLDGNNFSGNAIHILAGFMYLCPNLRVLVTSDCGITSDDLIHLLDLLSELNLSLPIVTWNLSHNDIGDVGVATLIERLPSLFPLLDRIYNDTEYSSYSSLAKGLMIFTGIDLRGNKVSSAIMSRLEDELKKRREAKEAEEEARRIASTAELLYNGSGSEEESDDESEENFQTQWELIVSLLYQSALDYLFCQPSLSLEVVGGIGGDFDTNQLAVDYQPSHNEVIDKGECNYGSHEFSSDEDFQTPPMSPPNTPPSPRTHSSISNDFNDKILEKEVPETNCSASPVMKSDVNVTEDQPLITKPLKEQLDHHLSLNDLAKVQRAVWEGRSLWYNLGLELLISPGTLDAIKRNNHHVSEDCFRAMLKEWLARSHHPPTWSSLSDALRSPTVGMGELADRLPP